MSKQIRNIEKALHLKKIQCNISRKCSFTENHHIFTTKNQLYFSCIFVNIFWKKFGRQNVREVYTIFVAHFDFLKNCPLYFLTESHPPEGLATIFFRVLRPSEARGDLKLPTSLWVPLAWNRAPICLSNLFPFGTWSCGAVSVTSAPRISVTISARISATIFFD